MSFSATLQVDDRIATIRLSGELDTDATDEVNELVTRAAEEDLTRLVLLLEDLTYISSGGLRTLLLANQKMSHEVEIVAVGARPQVAETIRMTGFDHSVVMQGSSET